MVDVIFSKKGGSMDIKWIKICTNIFDDEKILLIESLPEADSIIVIWFKLLTLAGKQNSGGVFLLNDKIAYTDEMLATIFRRPINTVRLALKTFENFGMIDVIENVITIPNWEKHQSIEANSDRREYMKNYMKKRREQAKMLAKSKNEENVENLEISSENSNKNNDLNDVNINSKLTLTVQNKNKNKNKKENKNKNNINCPDDVDEQVFNDYVQLRKAKKAPITGTVITRIRNEAQKANMTLNDALATCCARGWQGFNADWVKKETKQPEFPTDYGDFGAF